MSRLFIRGLWWIRGDHVGHCVCQVEQTFKRLASLSHHWSAWWRGYASIADRAAGPMYLSGRPDLILQELLNGRHQHNGQVLDDLGYFITASAGQPEGKGTEMTHLSVRCCARSVHAGFNDLTVELPEPVVAADLYREDLLSSTLGDLAEVWDPDWLSVNRRTFKTIPAPWEGGPQLGWINYLSPRIGIIDGGLPPRWRWFDQRGEKQIFIHEGGVPDPNKHNHVAAFQDIAKRVRWSAPKREVPGVS